MYVSVHFITSVILTGILYPFVGLYSLWVLVGGILIDFDHFLYTLVKFQNWSLTFSYEYHDDRLTDKYERDVLHIFHTVEFWIFMIVAAIICYAANWTFFFWMFTLTFAGMALHLLLDFIDLVRIKKFDARAISLIRWLKRRDII